MLRSREVIHDTKENVERLATGTRGVFTGK
jgi:hypothetical protein